MPSDGVTPSGINAGDVEMLRREVEAALASAIARLRKIEETAQQKLHEATLEQAHLQMFLDELNFRLKTVSSTTEPLVLITGPLTESQMMALQQQADALIKRRAELDDINSDLEQLGTRLSWLIHQIEGAGAWVLSTDELEEGDVAGPGKPSTGEQVMWAQIIMGQEAERARLAREIHDGPAQVLANTVMRLQLVEQMFKHNQQEAHNELAKMRATLQESLKDVRRFIFNLRPASLTDAGLLPTLKQYVSDYSEQHDIEVELNIPEQLVLSANQELVVFRVIQEALQNIHKHAEASRVSINIQQRPGGPIVVSIADNGRGFDPKLVRQSRPSSSGLVSMKERAATVGGTLKIDSKPGVGTNITLVLPIAKAS
jgi:two-component system sensor histidine kinase DegS